MAAANSASSKASAAQPGQGKGSAEQPESEKHLPLSELNKASAKTGGSWVVDVFRPFEDHYQYTWQGKPRQGTNLLVTFVSADPLESYLCGQLRTSPSVPCCILFRDEITYLRIRNPPMCLKIMFCFHPHFFEAQTRCLEK